MEVPRLVKVVVNMGVNDAKEDIKSMDVAAFRIGDDHRPEARRCVGRRSPFPILTCAKACRSGCASRCARIRMYEFLDRFINTAIPRIRETSGVRPPLVRRSRKLQFGSDRTSTFFRKLESDKSQVAGSTSLIVTNGRRRCEGAVSCWRFSECPLNRRDKDVKAAVNESVRRSQRGKNFNSRKKCGNLKVCQPFP